jgi:hypothetical protein
MSEKVYVPGTKESILASLNMKSVFKDGHWLFLGKRNKFGYGIFRGFRVHRLSMWIHKNFDLSSELKVLHECDIPNCWNPNCLKEGTQFENVQDAVKKGRAKFFSGNHGGAVTERNKTHCDRGHLLDGIRGNKKRYCKTCNRKRANKNYLRRKAHHV